VINLLSKTKYRLSHINANSWHWRLIHLIFEDRAYGKSCSYYWIKFPLSLLAIVILFVLAVILWFIQLATIFFMWFFGITFKYSPLNSEEDFWDSNNYYGYKMRKNERRIHIAPWEPISVALLGSILYSLVYKNINFLLIILLVLAGFLLVALFIYVITSTWKNPVIKRARANVKNSWDKACPPLIVEDTIDIDK
jgi:hypothetical protein